MNKTNNDLERKLEQSSSDSWLKKAFKEERPTIGNHLIACGVSIGSASSFSHFAPAFIDSDATISGVATAIDSVSYWSTFLPQLIYRDRKKLKDETGHFDSKKVLKKASEYLSYIGFGEGSYALIRFLGQYALQKKGWDPTIASVAIQACGTVFFTFAIPPVRYAVRQWSEK